MMTDEKRIVEAAALLTVIGMTDDGGIIVGPQGWHQLNEALWGSRQDEADRLNAEPELGTDGPIESSKDGGK